VEKKFQRAQFYGRRKGHKLRPRRSQLLNNLLPKVMIPLGSSSKSLNPVVLFDPPVKEIWMEIGFGAGEHLAHHARINPDIGFLGIEPFINGVANLLTIIEGEGLDNVRLLNDDVRLLLGSLAHNCLGRVFLLFPDPWPKKKHLKRRVLSDTLLDQLSDIMLPHSELRFASDNMCYVRFALELINKRKDFVWEPRYSDDWKTRPSDAIITRYEKKAERAGLTPIYLNFRKI